MTPAEIVAARAACAAATPGPWSVDSRVWTRVMAKKCLAIMEPDQAREEADARFIAISRAALPAALDAIERLEQRAAAAEARAEVMDRALACEDCDDQGMRLVADPDHPGAYATKSAPCPCGRRALMETLRGQKFPEVQQ